MSSTLRMFLGMYGVVGVQRETRTCCWLHRRSWVSVFFYIARARVRKSAFTHATPFDVWVVWDSVHIESDLRRTISHRYTSHSVLSY